MGGIPGVARQLRALLQLLVGMGLLAGVRASHHSFVGASLHQTCQATGDLLREVTSSSHVLKFRSGPPSPPDVATAVLRVDRDAVRQQVDGFGGAFTGASARNFFKLDEAEQKRILNAYWGSPEDGGHGYTVGRVPIGSCDFDPEMYSFDDVRNDTTLEHFDAEVQHDQVELLPLIRAAQATALAANASIRFIGSPWSPPWWMKVPNASGVQAQKGSAAPNGLLPEFQGSWALYLSKWIRAYTKQGVDVWAITTQNEAEFAPEHEGCLYTKEYMKEFIRDHLGPLLRAEHPAVKILGFDHNKDDVHEWAAALYGDPAAARFVDGLGVHWYTGEYFDNLHATHALAPEKMLIATEMCDCPVMINEAWLWDKAERQLADMLGDLNAWVSAWLDWNLILDDTGGPSHVGYSCGASVVTDFSGRFGRGRVLFQPNYYYTGHVTRWMRPGAHVVESEVQRGAGAAPGDLPLGEWGLLDADKVAMFPCDAGTRQQWAWENGMLRLANTELCLAVPLGLDLEWAAMQLEQCDEDAPGQRFLTAEADADGELVYIRTEASEGQHCLRLDWLHLSADHEVNKYWCDNTTIMQWHLNATDGTLRTALNLGWCVTGGARPMLRTAAAVAPDGTTTVVVLNRAAHAQPFELHDASAGLTLPGLSAPAHSIQTYVYNPGLITEGGWTNHELKVEEDESYFGAGVLTGFAIWLVGALLWYLRGHLCDVPEDRPEHAPPRGVRASAPPTLATVVEGCEEGDGAAGVHDRGEGADRADSERTETDGEDEDIEVVQHSPRAGGGVRDFFRRFFRSHRYEEMEEDAEREAAMWREGL